MVATFEYFEMGSNPYSPPLGLHEGRDTAGLPVPAPSHKESVMTKSDSTHKERELPIGDINSAAIEGVNALARFEAKVMEAVWALSRQVSVSEIQERMIEDAFRASPAPGSVARIAYTSVLTTVTRLAEKGYLKQDRSPASPTSRNAYMYSATMTRYEYRVMMAKALAKAAMEIEPLIANEVFNKTKTARKEKAKGEGESRQEKGQD